MKSLRRKKGRNKRRGGLKRRRKKDLSVLNNRPFRMEDAPRPPARRMGDKIFRDMLGEFTLGERGRVETGDTVGEWMVIGNEMA